MEYIFENLKNFNYEPISLKGLKLFLFLLILIQEAITLSS